MTSVSRHRTLQLNASISTSLAFFLCRDIVMMIRHQGIRHFSQIKLRPTASRSKRLPRPGTTLLGVSGILCCFLAAQTIYLDSEDKSPFASLKRRKSTEVFDIRRPVDVEVKLRQHEQTCETDKNSGISRFDIVQVSR